MEAGGIESAEGFQDCPAEIGAEAGRLLLDVIEGLNVSDVDVAAAALLLCESTGERPRRQAARLKDSGDDSRLLEIQTPQNGATQLTLAFAALASLGEEFLSERTAETSTTQYVVWLGPRIAASSARPDYCA